MIKSHKDRIKKYSNVRAGLERAGLEPAPTMNQKNLLITINGTI